MQALRNCNESDKGANPTNYEFTYNYNTSVVVG
jgi:hypothetical protein